jgi:hypothetical protein
MTQNNLIRKHVRVILLIFLSVLLPLQIILAQNSKEAKGKVLDASTNKAVSQASVMVKGTNKGIVTNSNGEFSIQAKTGDILVISFAGYENKQETVTRRSSIDILLQPGTSKLDEVMVIGYGTQQKSDLTGVVSSVKSKTLAECLSTSVARQLQGRIARKNVSVNSGRPGGKPTIRIRSNTSISITNDPLFIVEGVISSIEFLEPNNIASI